MGQESLACRYLRQRRGRGVLLDPARHANQTYRLTGPGALGYDEVASAIGAVAGRPVTYEPVTPENYEARLLQAPAGALSISRTSRRPTAPYE